MASRRAWLALSLTATVTAAGIWFVHDAQVQERAALHEGVLRDAKKIFAGDEAAPGDGEGGGDDGGGAAAKGT